MLAYDWYLAAGPHRQRALGLKESLRPSPNRLKVKRSSTSTLEGTRVRWGSLRRTEMLPFSKIITPRLGVGG